MRNQYDTLIKIKLKKKKEHSTWGLKKLVTKIKILYHTKKVAQVVDEVFLDNF